MNKLLNIINQILEEAGNSPVNSLENSTRLRDDLNLDSLMLAELTVIIENEFGVDIFEDGIVETIGEVVSKIEGK